MRELPGLILSCGPLELVRFPNCFELRMGYVDGACRKVAYGAHELDTATETFYLLANGQPVTLPVNRSAANY